MKNIINFSVDLAERPRNYPNKPHIILPATRYKTPPMIFLTWGPFNLWASNQAPVTPPRMEAGMETVSSSEFICPMAAWLTNAAKEENITIKPDVAAALRGSNPTQINTGTMILPPPTPKRPPIYPASAPITPPTISPFFKSIFICFCSGR